MITTPIPGIQAFLSVMVLNIYTKASLQHTTEYLLITHSTIPITMIQLSSTLIKWKKPKMTLSVTSILSSTQQDYTLTTELEENMISTPTQRAVSSEGCQLPFADKTKMIEIESVRVN